MTKPVVPQRAAVADVRAAVDYYSDQASEQTVFRLIEAIDAAYRTIGQVPEAGSTRLGVSAGMPTLRTWMLRGFPYVVCCEDEGDRIAVLRLLHAQRDLPAALGETADD